MIARAPEMPDQDAPPVVWQIAALRMRGYTQREIAARLGVSERTIWNWKQQREEPQRAQAIALACLASHYHEHPDSAA